MKIRIGLMLCLCVCLVFCGCATKEKQENEMYVYYLNADGNALIQETYPKKDVKDTLAKLKTHGVINETVKLEKYKQKGSNLELYFTTDYVTLSKGKEVLTRAAIVQTMTQLDQVNFVEFYVGADPLINEDGVEIGMMRAEDFVQNTGSSIDAYQTTDLELYFADKDGERLKINKRNNVRYNANTSTERLVIEQLMKGITAEGYQSTIPTSATLLGVSVKEDICYVNFDSKFESESNSDLSPEVVVYSIVNSLVANSDVTKVQILIDGESDNEYKNSVDLSRPLKWNEDFMKE